MSITEAIAEARENDARNFSTEPCVVRALLGALAAEREKVRTLRSALQNLCDEQNDAPLETRRAHWQMAMDEAGLALATAAAALR